MDDIRSLLCDAIEALRIGRRGGFSWFGRPAAGDPALQRLMSREQLRHELQARVQFRLYESFYCLGYAAPASAEEELQPNPEDFVRQLSKANRGRGSIENGWRIVQRRRGVVIISKDGLSLEAERSAVAGLRSGSASLRLPKEMLGISPGFYTALGNRQPATRAQLIRVYWNLRPDGAVAFIRGVTEILNRRAIPFRAKIVANPRRFHRTDAAVIYLPAGDCHRAYDAIHVLHRRLENALKPLTPVFAKRIAPGVAVAEDPGESFGQHRCGIVAEALLRAAEEGKRGVKARFEEVAAEFHRHGIALSRPFLNPGADDVYPMLTS